jgi:hypothetical protein
MHLSVRAGVKESVKQPASGVPERLLSGLPLTGTETVERNRKVVNTNEWHARTPWGGTSKLKAEGQRPNRGMTTDLPIHRETNS